MTREEAEQQAAVNNREHPDRRTHQWIARQSGDGDWHVARIVVPGLRVPPGEVRVESKPKPPLPGDPRSTYDRNVGGPWVA